MKYKCIMNFNARSPVNEGIGDYYNLHYVEKDSIWELLYSNSLSGSYTILFDENKKHIMLDEDDMKFFEEIKEKDWIIYLKGE